MSVTFEEDFPYEEIRQESGDYFDSWKQAKEAGFDDNQIWSVCLHGYASELGIQLSEEQMKSRKPMTIGECLQDLTKNK